MQFAEFSVAVESPNIAIVRQLSLKAPSRSVETMAMSRHSTVLS